MCGDPRDGIPGPQRPLLLRGIQGEVWQVQQEERVQRGAVNPTVKAAGYQSSQKKSCAEELEVGPEALQGAGGKGSAEGSSGEEEKLVIYEPAKEKKGRKRLPRKRLKPRASHIMRACATNVSRGAPALFLLLSACYWGNWP